jgi:hypothetical protein
MAQPRRHQSVFWLAVSLLCQALPSAVATAQTALPEVQVKPVEQATSRRKLKPKQSAKMALGGPPNAPVSGATPSAAAGPQPSGVSQAMVVPTYETADAVRATILPPTGVNVTGVNQAQIEAQPLGDNTPIEKTLLQTPGFSQDSAASGALHLRNDHANVQYRIDGVWVPDGVSGFSQLLDSGFIGNLNVIDGALPAEYGLHTTGIVDITPRSHAFDGGGAVGVFGGSQGAISPTLQYGGTADRTEFYVIGRGFWTTEGIENPTPAYRAIHDRSDQEKFFAYAKTYLGDGSTITIMSGASLGAYQIPNNPGQPLQFPLLSAVPVSSSQINENQYEQSYYNVLAWQKSFETIDVQLSAFSRYGSLHFVPDQVGDLEFNGVASNVFRSSFLDGVQGDAAWRASAGHTLRFGFTGSGELAHADNTSAVFPVDASGNVDGAPFVAPAQLDSKVGWLLGTYAQDEWRITKQLTLNTGLRFDQMYGYVEANQFSPRINGVYKITPLTTFHVGYARYFTPPELSLSAPTNLVAFNGTTQQAAVPLDDPVRPERSNYFDTGIDQQLSQWLTAGVDGYYKRATDLIDDGQFGQANTLTAFNYAKGWNEGVEGKFRYDRDNFSLYGNVAWGHQYATEPNSNQFLWADPAEYAYAMTHYIPTDHSQTWTGSAGASYLWYGTRFSVDAIFGSGLRNGFANLTTVPAYSQINLGVSHVFQSPDTKPLTVSFSVVNVLDSVYVIRDGTGIGVFAPQYGPRRGFYLSLSQAI